MNRPLALIQGDLALPNARLLQGLPPPFGLQQWPARGAMQRRAQSMAAAAAAQQAIQKAMRRTGPLRHSPLPPGTKFRFFYSLPQPRDYSSLFEAQLSEARHYLDAGKTRPCSSRSDHVLGAAVFSACSIALAWLLTISATHDADKVASVVMAQPAVVRPEEPASSAQRAAEVARTVPENAPPVADRVSPGSLRNEPMSLPQAAALPARARKLPQRSESYKAARTPAYDAVTRRAANSSGNTRSAVARLGEAHVNERLALSRSMHPSTRLSASMQPEWSARSPSVSDAPDQAALRDWAAQQRRATVTTRATAPTPGDTNWNNRMTQRRITDNPDAFQADAAQR